MAGIFWYSIVYPTDYRKCHLAVFQQMISEGENAIMKEKKRKKLKYYAINIKGHGNGENVLINTQQLRESTFNPAWKQEKTSLRNRREEE